MRYLEQLLRLAPHWRVTRVIELSPNYWTRTLAALDDRHRAVITAPWEIPSPPADAAAKPAGGAAQTDAA